MTWFSGHCVEVLGVLFSLVYLYFSIRQNILLWPAGILSAILYMVVFFRSKFYADMALNGYYFLISIYGWLLWRKGGAEGEEKLPVTRAGKSLAVLLGMITLASFAVIGWILDRFTDSPVPYWDAFTTALSFTATWMLARKILEHWLVWVVVDVVSMGLYLYRGLYPTLVLFLVYTIMAVIGYRQWMQDIKSEGTGEAGPEMLPTMPEDRGDE